MGVSLLTTPLVLATCAQDVTGPDPIIPATLDISVTSVADSAKFGSTVIRTASLTVSGTNQQSLRWTATLAKQSAWISLSASSGGVPRTITVTLDPEDLSMGLHRDTIIFMPTGNLSARKLVPVQLEISPCAVYTIAYGAEVSDSLGVEDCEAPNRSDRFAKLHSFGGNAGDSVTVILRSADFQGYLVLADATPNSAPPLAEDVRCRGFASDPCLYYIRLPANGTYIIQATTKDARATGAYTLAVHQPRYPSSPTALGQFFQDGVTSIAVGGTVGDTSLAFRAIVTDADSLDDLRLQVEVRPLGTAFSGTPTDSSQIFSPGETGLVSVSTLDDTEYHWQARTVDGTGRASAWVSFGGNAESDPDFGVGVSEVPPVPGELAQFRLDSVTAVAMGESLDEAAVVLRGTVSDPDPNDLLQFEVEVQPVGTALTGTATAASETLASGATALVSIVGLREDTQYHWWARTVDDGGSASAWVSFGGNDEDERTDAADLDAVVRHQGRALRCDTGKAVEGGGRDPALRVWCLTSEK